MNFISTSCHQPEDVIQAMPPAGTFPARPPAETGTAGDSGGDLRGTQAPESRRSALDIVDHLLPAVPGLTAKLDLGINLLQPQCRDPLALLELARRFPRSRFAGTSATQAGISSGRIQARKYGLQNVWMTQAGAWRSAYGPFFDAALLPGGEGQILDQRALAAVAVQLKPEGILLLYTLEPGIATLRARLGAGGFASVRQAVVPGGRAGYVCVARR